METVSFTPIGILRSDQKHRYEAPKQGILAAGSLAVIHLNPHQNFEQALKDLDGFERIWVLFCFHKNSNWRPLVKPPLYTEKKIGVFATRAPFRPNAIGISCVKLLKVDGLRIFITESDILDGSPILDIKPYLPYSDSFPESKTGWACSKVEDKYSIIVQQQANEQAEWLKEHGKIKLINFVNVQLEFRPTDSSRKRITSVFNEESTFILAYRTWRILYTVSVELKQVEVKKIFSGYSVNELRDLSADKYDDKPLHRKFKKEFG